MIIKNLEIKMEHVANFDLNRICLFFKVSIDSFLRSGYPNLLWSRKVKSLEGSNCVKGNKKFFVQFRRRNLKNINSIQVESDDLKLKTNIKIT